ncbi:MAG: helical backbone metal receptor [Candidatus Eremiobacteraeota bacterium]|nr:helical backbone metal receptor [Candidatus Eremiobacteraeota bacterium]
MSHYRNTGAASSLREQCAAMRPALWTLLVALCLLGACVQRQRSGAHLEVHQRRIVSLIPSLTEDLFGIGAGAQVVGVDELANYPPAAQRLPKVSSFSTIDSERIVRLHPDVVVGIPSQERLTTPLRTLGIHTVFLKDDSFDDIFGDLHELGKLSGHSSEATALSNRLRAQTAQLRAGIRFNHKVSCFVVLATNPIITVGRGSYIARLIELAGGRNASDSLLQPYGAFSAEALLRLQPEVLISDRQTHLQDVLQREPWRSLRAVARKRVFFTDVLYRPGPRYNEGLSWLIARFKQTTS